MPLTWGTDHSPHCMIVLESIFRVSLADPVVSTCNARVAFDGWVLHHRNSVQIGGIGAEWRSSLLDHSPHCMVVLGSVFRVSLADLVASTGNERVGFDGDDKLCYDGDQ